MPLVTRLTLAFAGALALMLAGLGLTVYRVIERDFQRDFARDLATLARVQAGLAVQERQVRLTRVPGAALAGAFGEPEAFLLRPDGTLIETLVDSAPPRLPGRALRQARAGETVTVIEGPRRAGWWEVFQPRMTVHTRVVAHPIYGYGEGRFGVAYLIALRARDEHTVAALTRVRGAVLAWLGGGLLLAAGVGYLLARVIAAPVGAMARTAQAVQDGDLDARARGTERRDELGALARNLNAMLGRLSALVTAARRFTADAAHDLRTPLAVLRGEVDLALRRERTPAEYRETLTRLRADLAGLSRLADDLLTLARLEGQGRDAGASAPPVPLSEVLALPLRTAGPLAAARGHRLRADVPPGLWVSGDPALLSRALLNLLVNAVTHGGHTHLTAERRGGWLCLRVRDDGPGVPPELRGDALFARFARGAASEGSGLGVAIAREVARVHGGALTYVGPPDGPSTFTLTLPEPALPREDRA